MQINSLFVFGIQCLLLGLNFAEEVASEDLEALPAMASYQIDHGGNGKSRYYDNGPQDLALASDGYGLSQDEAHDSSDHKGGGEESGEEGHGLKKWGKHGGGYGHSGHKEHKHHKKVRFYYLILKLII